MNTYAIAFDVGGLFIKSAVLDANGHMCPGTYSIYPSKSKESKEVMLEHFFQLIKHQANRILDKAFEIYGVGYAFPGPFDYPRGISYIKGIDKFEQLYGVNLKEELTERLQRDPQFAAKQSAQFQIAFENDANLFALGAWYSGHASEFDRSICITIGTGAGSAFIENGRLVTDREDVPPNGWIYNQPFGMSIVDDYISKRGIMRLAEQAGLDTRELEVKMIADMARCGNEAALSIFNQFGVHLGNALQPFVASFQPDAIIIGGQIAKSNLLFMDGLTQSLNVNDLAIRTVEETSQCTFVGVASLLMQSAQRSGANKLS